jgi:hypothetical protein
MSLMRGLKVALLCAALPAAGQTPAGGQEARWPSAAEFAKLHRLLRPQPGESRWMEVAWHPSVWEGRRKAAAEGKPLFLWAGSGGAPAAGC